MSQKKIRQAFQAALDMEPILVAGFGSREETRRERRGGDAERGVIAEIMNAAANGCRELRVSREKSQARFDLEHDALAVDAHQRRELRAPRRQTLEGLALRIRIPRYRAQLSRQRLGRGHRLTFANSRGPGRFVRARDERALRCAFGDHQGFA